LGAFMAMTLIDEVNGVEKDPEAVDVDTDGN
jgi:hypothetical protein